MRTLGMTLLETLTVLAIVAILGTAAIGLRSRDFAFARAYAAGVAAARARAAVSGHPVAVGVGPCAWAADSLPVDPAPASLLSFPARGLVFMPDGSPRTCDGGGVGNTSIVLVHRDRRAAVVVSALGRVRWERR